MARYRVHVERTTVDTAVVEIEIPEGTSPDEVDWPQAIEDHLDAQAELPSLEQVDVEWNLDSATYDVEGGTEPEPAGG
jgi:hypothetical protein